jgi:outer membrane receptor for ferrienterochelin and colicins
VTTGISVSGLLTGYRNRTTGRSNGELGPQEDDARDHAFSANVAGQWLYGDTTAEVRGYLSRYFEEASGRLAPPRSTDLEPGSLEERFGKADLTVARTLGARQLLQGGLEWSRSYYDGTNRVRDEGRGHKADTAVVWGQHRWSATDRLTTTLGVRVDGRSGFETAVSPKVAANFRLTPDLVARASYGRRFRAPDLGRLYYRFLSPSNFYQVIGKPALDAEYVHSWQVGTEYYATMP